MPETAAMPEALPAELGGPTAAPAGALRRLARRVGGLAIVWYLLAVALVLAVWELVVLLGSTPEYLLPTPAQVADALSTYREPLSEQTWVTLREVLIAFGVSVAAGVANAVPIAFVRAVERIAYPLLVMSQAIPKIALGPLFIVWFGFGLRTNVLIAVSVSIFPIIVNTALGLSSIDPDLVRL